MGFPHYGLSTLSTSPIRWRIWHGTWLLQLSLGMTCPGIAGHASLRTMATYNPVGNTWALSLPGLLCPKSLGRGTRANHYAHLPGHLELAICSGLLTFPADRVCSALSDPRAGKADGYPGGEGRRRRWGAYVQIKFAIPGP